MKNFSSLNDNEIDSYIGTELRLREPNAEHAQTFLEAAKRLCEIRDRSPYWNHSVCHFIEKYGQRDYDSLLDYLDSGFPQYQEAMDMLVAKAFPDTNCLDRILCPVLSYNLDKEAETGNHEAFAYLPPALALPENLAVAQGFFTKSEHNDTRGVRLMMESKSPRELWEKAQAEKVPLFSGHAIEKYKKSPLSKEALITYLDACYDIKKRTGGMDANTVVENLFVESTGKTLKGVFVDVDDTLLHANGQANEGLVKSLKEAEAAGVKVTIISGGDPETQKERLAQAGMVVKKVIPKASLRGAKLETLIDDTKPALSGFGANTYLFPHYNQTNISKELARMAKKDPEPEL
jgi:hypothetical protein